MLRVSVRSLLCPSSACGALPPFSRCFCLSINEKFVCFLRLQNPNQWVMFGHTDHSVCFWKCCCPSSPALQPLGLLRYDYYHSVCSRIRTGQLIFILFPGDAGDGWVSVLPCKQPSNLTRQGSHAQTRGNYTQRMFSTRVTVPSPLQGRLCLFSRGLSLI